MTKSATTISLSDAPHRVAHSFSYPEWNTTESQPCHPSTGLEGPQTPSATIRQQHRLQAMPVTPANMPHAQIALESTQHRPTMQIVSLVCLTKCSIPASLQETPPHFLILVAKNHSRAVPTRNRRKHRRISHGISTPISITRVHGIVQHLVLDNDNRRLGMYSSFEPTVDDSLLI